MKNTKIIEVVCNCLREYEGISLTNKDIEEIAETIKFKLNFNSELDSLSVSEQLYLLSDDELHFSSSAPS